MWLSVWPRVRVASSVSPRFALAPRENDETRGELEIEYSPETVTTNASELPEHPVLLDDTPFNSVLGGWWPSYWPRPKCGTAAFLECIDVDALAPTRCQRIIVNAYARELEGGNWLPLMTLSVRLERGAACREPAQLKLGKCPNAQLTPYGFSMC
jgi:hypothetical protein